MEGCDEIDWSKGWEGCWEMLQWVPQPLIIIYKKVRMEAEEGK